MKYWEIIADKLSESDWTWGLVKAVTPDGKPMFVVDAYRENGKRFIVRSDQLFGRVR
jgi:hypothetical protein